MGTVKEVPAARAATVTALVATLREATGRVDLELAAPPVPLTGGFYAEMLRFRLADAPPGLEGDLVARIVPDPIAGEWEATVQRAVAGQGFPTPAVRLSAGAAGPLGRYLIVMDALDGRSPMSGLGIGAVATEIPHLLRRLPDQLARLAADLHALDPAPLAEALDALDTTVPTTTAGFVEQQAGVAAALGHRDIAAAGERLLATEPRSRALVITHGDLHPFNVIATDAGPALVDWTVARVAHPGFTLGFADLMLANPPIRLPAAGAAVMRRLGRNVARRFLSTYGRLTDGTCSAVDADNLDWHRKVHALRILVELAGWDSAGTHPAAHHPWLVLEPVACRLLGLGLVGAHTPRGWVASGAPWRGAPGSTSRRRRGG